MVTFAPWARIRNVLLLRGKHPAETEKGIRMGTREGQTPNHNTDHKTYNMRVQRHRSSTALRPHLCGQTYLSWQEGEEARGSGAYDSSVTSYTSSAYTYLHKSGATSDVKCRVSPPPPSPSQSFAVMSPHAPFKPVGTLPPPNTLMRHMFLICLSVTVHM